MAKKIKYYSKLDNNEKKHINTLITNGELKVIDINSEKKGVLVSELKSKILKTATIYEKQKKESRPARKDKEMAT